MECDMPAKNKVDGDKQVTKLPTILQNYSLDDIIKLLKGLRDLKVLVIGDAIIDEYRYCEPLGKSSAGPLLVHRHLSAERFAGATLIIANNVAELCSDVRLMTMLDRTDSPMEYFIRNKLNSRIFPLFFHREGSTILKTRFVDPYLNQVLFQVDRIEEGPMPTYNEKEILRCLEERIPGADLVMVCDFGHGLITKRIIRLLEKCSPLLAVNVQTNSANVGFNTIRKYHHADFVCLNEMEARLACQDRYGDMGGILKKLALRLKTKQLIVTRGSRGCISFDFDIGLHGAPALCTTVVDRVGAGDAFFAFVAPCFAGGLPPDVVSFVGNVAGALAAQIIGNREPVGVKKLFEFIQNLAKKD